MAVTIAINGFGRIGRLVLRAIVESGREDLVPVVVNDLDSVAANAHVLRYDRVHDQFPGDVAVTDEAITIYYLGRSFGPIHVLAEKDPLRLPLAGVDVALECTGHVTSKEEASVLLQAGARKVLISAPADDADATIVYGVNHNTIAPGMTVISSASSTTNCLAPMAKVLHQAIGIARGYMVTIQAYTGDTLQQDLHRSGAAALSLIPTSTGTARAVGLVMPELEGTLDGIEIRAPTPNVSLVLLDVVLSKESTADELNAAMREASSEDLKGILDYNTAPLVSINFRHTSVSCIFDATQTKMVGHALAHVAGWYDNEWGLAHHMVDTAALLGRLR